MYQCSWITNEVQCQNLTDHLVCDQCESTKNKLYHEYKEAEKTVIAAINDSLPRGDLLEASKVIGRINRVIKLRRKFTSHLAAISRDIGHEYHVSQLLEKLQQYRAYISKCSTDQTGSIEEEDTSSDPVHQEYYQQSISVAIRDVVESDPFEKYDSVIQSYRQDEQAYYEFLADVEKLTGYSGENLELVITFISSIHDAITITMKYLSRLITRPIRIEHNFTKYIHDISLLPHRECIDYFKLATNSNLMNTVLMNWIVTHVKDTARVCFKAITVNNKKIIALFFRNRKLYCPIIFHMNIYIGNSDMYDLKLDPIEVTPDILSQLVVKRVKFYTRQKIR